MIPEAWTRRSTWIIDRLAWVSCSSGLANPAFPDSGTFCRPPHPARNDEDRPCGAHRATVSPPKLDGGRAAEHAGPDQAEQACQDNAQCRPPSMVVIPGFSVGSGRCAEELVRVSLDLLQTVFAAQVEGVPPASHLDGRTHLAAKLLAAHGANPLGGDRLFIGFRDLANRDRAVIPQGKGDGEGRGWLARIRQS